MTIKKSKALFFRKPSDLNDLSQLTRAYINREMVHGVTIQKNVELSNKKYDKMVSNFFAEQPYLAGRGGWAKDGTRYAIRVTSQNRNTLLIDPQGYNYARYVGFEIN